MFTRKDERIANQKIKIQNRDILIKKQQEEIVKLKNVLEKIKVLASSNLYGTDGTAYLRKIKELSTTLDGIR